MRHHRPNGPHSWQATPQPQHPLTWEDHVEAELNAIKSRVTDLEDAASKPSTWTPVWQDVVKRLPWEKVGYVLGFGALVAVNKSPELRALLHKWLGLG
jgi:hypothetical protein